MLFVIDTDCIKIVRSEHDEVEKKKIVDHIARNYFVFEKAMLYYLRIHRSPSAFH